MDCLIGFIGLSSSIGESGSGLYLNTLPNINIMSINKIADNEQQDYVQVMKDVERRTINRFRTEFIRELNKCYRINKREIAECLICENKELLAVALQFLMGVEMMIERINSSRINKYTTTDKITAQRVRAEFEERFYVELHVAVIGIDIENSCCFEKDIPEPKNLLSFVEETP